MAKLILEAEMPKHLLREFLQALRDAECKHFHEIMVKYRIEGKECTVEEAEKIFRSIQPPYDEVAIRSFDGNS
jgi:hypothetical protein